MNLLLLKVIIETMEHHRSIAQQHVIPSHNLNEWFASPSLESKFHERAQHLQQMINDAKASHRLLTLSSEHWTQFQDLASQIDQWLKKANVQLQKMINKAERDSEKLSQDDCFQYWVSRVLCVVQLSTVDKYVIGLI